MNAVANLLNCNLRHAQRKGSDTTTSSYIAETSSFGSNVRLVDYFNHFPLFSTAQGALSVLIINVGKIFIKCNKEVNTKHTLVKIMLVKKKQIKIET